MTEPKVLSDHSTATCDKLLRADPSHDTFRCQPKLWMCECGRAWAHVCDEAEGCFYWHVEKHDSPARAALEQQEAPKEGNDG
jgi:hypothetical protein